VRRGLLVAPLLALGHRSGAQTAPLRLGTTTTVEQSGALSVVDSLWRGGPLVTVVGPSGQILRSAAAGDLDVVITHAPTLEAKWLGGRALLRCPFVASQFAIVGPADDPAQVRRARDGADAMARIAQRGSVFVSRGDSSGTHVKELALWARAGVDPRHAPWYLESGAGQAATLQIADQRQGYALADLPTLARVEGIALWVLFAGDTALANPYTLYVVNAPVVHPAARAFASFATGPWRAHLVQWRLSNGTPAFIARTGGCTTDTTGGPGAGDSTATGLLGIWQYRAPVHATAPGLSAGLIVTIEFDSLRGPVAYGRVTQWFAGDAGVSPESFGPVTGGAEGRAVSFSIAFARPGLAPIAVRGELRGDTLAIMATHRGEEPGPFAIGPGTEFVRVHLAR
jgi:tungstate transport system substrate-binding protein